MKITLFKYILKMQFKTMLFLSFFMFCLILLFDFAEVTRKFPISETYQVICAIKLSFLRTPSTFCEILHYVYFMATTFNLWHLTTSNQMTILKSAGRSPMQILLPFITFASFVAVVWLLILHPLGNYAEEIYNQSVKSQACESNENIWIDCSGDNQLIFIKHISNNEINGLYVFDINNNERIFAKNALIEDGNWNLKNITVINCDLNKTRNINDLILHNNISNELIKLLAKSPKKQNIYSLHKVYKIQSKDKVRLQLYEFELQKLLANCMNFILFALVAAAICFPINRYKTKTEIAIQTIIFAMLLRFMNNMLYSLAYTNVLSIYLAAWATVMIALFFTISVLIWKEV